MLSLASEFSMLENYLLTNTHSYDILGVETMRVSLADNIREIRCHVREYQPDHSSRDYDLFLRNGKIYNAFGTRLGCIYEEI